MSGFETGFGTTTFKVAEIDLSEKEFVAKYAMHYKRISRMSFKEAKVCAIDLLEAATRFPLGVMLERRGDEIRTRGDPESTAD